MSELSVVRHDGIQGFIPDLDEKEPYTLANKTVHIAESDKAPFVPMQQVNTVAAISSEVTIEQMKKNIKKGYERLHNLPEFKKIKCENIALVGGGPSLKDNLEKLKEFKNIIVCGSAHDYLIEQGIIPTYATVCDPDAISANYLIKNHKDVKYLVSSGCDDKVFDLLKDKQIYMWHCYSDEYLKRQAELEENFQAVGGGCTVGLRSISIALMLGYSDMHFFGFDSCLGVSDGSHHAYEFTDETQEQLGQIYQIRLGMNGTMNQDKVFNCAGYQLAQCAHFKDFYGRYNRMFTPTFHGEGLLAELMKIINKERDKLALEQNLDLKQENVNTNLKGLLETATVGKSI